MTHIFPMIFFQYTYIVLFEVSFLQTAYGFLIYSAIVCFLFGEFRLFTFGIITGMLGLKFANLFFVFCLLSLFFIFIFPAILRFTEYFLRFLFWLIDTSLFSFIHVAPDITLYIQFMNATSVDILPVWKKCRNFNSLYDSLPSPMYTIIFVNISSTYCWNHIRQYYNFCFNH